MKQPFIALGLGAFLLSGCASHKKAESKPIHQRPWIGGQFETVSTPKTVRTNASLFGRNAPLITTLHEGEPLQKAGLETGDLILAVNGAEVRYPRQVREAVQKKGTSPSSFTIYRQGEILEKSVAPGVERYQEIGNLTFGIGLSTHLNLDIFPNPDFSLGALGYEEEHERLDLRDPKSLYLRRLAAEDAKTDPASAPLRSDEGWKFWLGPLSVEKRKLILSQE